MSAPSKNTRSPKFDYDLLVIGCGPAGQRAAVQAAKLKKRTAIIDKHEVIGGVCVSTGAVPTNSFRETVMFLSGYRQRHLYGSGYQVKSDIEIGDLTFRSERLKQIEVEVLKNQLSRNGVELIQGHARFLDAHTMEVSPPGGAPFMKSAEKIIIAVGARPVHPPKIEFDGKHIFDSDSMLRVKELPRSLAVVGGGVLGTVFGSIFAALGVHVTIIDKLKRPLGFLDDDVIETLHYQLRGAGVTLRFGEEVSGCRVDGGHATVQIKGGKEVAADCALFTVGRQSATDDLGLEKIGIEPTSRGKVTVNEAQQTKAPHIYAAGDVTGFPGLASTAAQQGRRSVAHAFGAAVEGGEQFCPYGLYCIPEISCIGLTEKEAAKGDAPCEVGLARYREITRGHLLGDENGLLKLVFDRQSGKILGVHIIGEEAAELVHIGQTAMAFGADLNYFANAVFNYPTLAECYKVAALDGLNRLRRSKDAQRPAAERKAD